MTNLLETAQELKNACMVLHSMCDGALKQDDRGFNKPDATFGNWIALVPADQWDADTCAIVRQMLTKYVGQLNASGIEELPQVKTPSKGRNEVFNEMKHKGIKAGFRAGTLSVSQVLDTTKELYLGKIEGQAFRIFSPKDYKLIQEIKSIQPWQNRRWNPDMKCWEVRFGALDKSNKEVLFGIIESFGFLVSDEDLAQLKETTVVEKTEKETIHVYVKGDQIVFQVPFNRNAIADIKDGLVGRTWNPGKKVWTAVKSPKNMEKAAKLAEKYSWNLSDDFKVDAKETIEKAAVNVEASQAVESSLELPSLADGYDLYPFQKAGVEYALKNKNVLIGDEMGLGKTLQGSATVVAASAFPCLVVCPKAVKKQWQQEINKFFPDQSVSLVENKGTDWSANFIIVNYDIVKKNMEKLSSIPFKAMILDESHYIKNVKAQRSQAVMSLAEGVEYRIELTGTPVLNRPIELVNQLNFLGKLDNLFGGFFPFVKRYCDAHQTMYGWDMTGASNLDELAEVLRSSCFVRREKKDVFKELPALQRTVIPCPISASSAKEFAKDLKETQKRVSTMTDEMVLVEINRMKREAAQYKYDSALEWVKNFLESGEKLVLFAHHRDLQDKLFSDLQDFNPAKISGGDSGEMRERNTRKFWDDDTCKVIVCSLKAANVGLNLQCASNVAFFEFAWHSGDMDQAEARVHRIGSEATSINSYWLKGERTFDSSLINLIEAKRQVAEAVNQGVEVDKKLLKMAKMSPAEWLESLVKDMDGK